MHDVKLYDENYDVKFAIYIFNTAHQLKDVKMVLKENKISIASEEEGQRKY